MNESMWFGFLRLAFLFLLYLPTIYAHSQLLPHLPSESGLFGGRVIISSFSSKEIKVRLLPYSHSGQELSSEYQVLNIPPNSKIQIESQEAFTHHVSHLRAESDFPFFLGIEYYRKQNPHDTFFIPALKIENLSSKWQINNLFGSESNFIGLVIVNPWDRGATVDLELVNKLTGESEIKFLSIPPRGKFVDLIDFFFELEFQKDYVLHLNSRNQIAVLGLTGSNAPNSLSLFGNIANPILPNHFEIQIELQEAMELWNTHGWNKDYVYSFDGTGTPKSIIRVEKWHVIDAMNADSGSALSLHEVKGVLTVEEVFELLADAISKNADYIEVYFHEEFGYVQRLFIDYDQTGDGGEIWVYITELRFLD